MSKITGLVPQEDYRIEVLLDNGSSVTLNLEIKEYFSPENKEQLSTLLKDIWKNTSSKIATSRKIDSAQFQTVVDSLYGIIPDLSMQHKLVDQLVQKSQYDDLIKTKLNLKDQNGEDR